LHGNVAGKKTNLDKPLYANIGIGRDFEGYIHLGEVTDAERCFVCSCNSSRSAECQASLPRKKLIEDNVPYDVSTAAMINASTRLSFETPQENRFVQVIIAMVCGVCVCVCDPKKARIFPQTDLPS
jgi:hypothetical protein